MLVSIRRAKSALAGAAILGSASIFLMYDFHRNSRDHEEAYNKLMQEQTVGLSKKQAKIRRLKVIEQHKQLFDELEQKKSTEQQRREVLARLELLAKHTGLFDINYQFLSTQHHTEIGRNINVVSDGLRLKGVAQNIVVFNHAISELGDGAPYFFELKTCDIKRKKLSDSGLDFECILNWYLLV